MVGASGVIGRRVVPLLVAHGHQVVATTRSVEKTEELRAAGAAPVVVDLLDRGAVTAAVRRAEPILVAYLILGKLYWFNVPFRGTALAFILYLTGIIMAAAP